MNKEIMDQLTQHKTDSKPTLVERDVGYRLEVRLRDRGDRPMLLADDSYVTSEWAELSVVPIQLPDELKRFALGDGSCDPLKSRIPTFSKGRSHKMNRWKLLSLIQTVITIIVLILVVIAGVNLQRTQRRLEKRISDLESHAGAQDLALCTIGETILGPGKGCFNRPITQQH